MNTFGTDFRITVFGESHGECVGCVIDGLPAGFTPDLDHVRNELSRRAPKGTGSTERRENDYFEILSGVFNGKTCGTPLTVVFRNRDRRSEDYSDFFARPSHADLAAFVKYSANNDRRGGGMFSGRMTVPLVFCGTLAKQLLSMRGISIASHIFRIRDIFDEPFSTADDQIPVLDPDFPLIDLSKKAELIAALEKAKKEGDSLGGTAECKITGLPIGIGEPFFDCAESVIAHLLFSIPGIHGVEFGTGFGFAAMQGSEANDAIIRGMRTVTNHSGGINGGISNGMPIIFRTVFRPVPSIKKEQQTIDLKTGNETHISIGGRHDVCILPRGLAVIEAAAAIAILDLMIRNGAVINE